MEFSNVQWEMALPSLIAFILKSLFLFNTSINNRLSSAFVFLCLMLVIQNAFEFCAFLSYPNSVTFSEYCVDGYMLATYFIIAAVINFTLAICGIEHKPLMYTVLALAIVISALHLSGLLIDSYHYNGYALIAVRGDFYVVFELYALSISIIYMWILIKTMRDSDNADIRSRAMLASLAMAPYSLITIFFIVTMHFGYQASSAVWVPIAGVFFLFITKKASKRDIYDMSKALLIFKFIMQRHGEFLFDEEVPVLDRVEFMEKFLIMEALDKYKGNQKQAAQHLKIAESTLSRKIKKYDIDKAQFTEKGSA